ncbi:MAG TPA: MoaD/ThiS family protein [Kofleriaceae bacterium]|jgi:molybdopterin converting factor small subunit
MKFRFSGTLMRFVEFEREQEFAAATIREAIDGLVAKHPQLQNVLFTASGSLRQTHRLFLNGDQLGNDELARAVGEQDVVEVLTAIAGG